MNEPTNGLPVGTLNYEEKTPSMYQKIMMIHDEIDNIAHLINEISDRVSHIAQYPPEGMIGKESQAQIGSSGEPKYATIEDHLITYMGKTEALVNQLNKINNHLKNIVW